MMRKSLTIQIIAGAMCLAALACSSSSQSPPGGGAGGGSNGAGGASAIGGSQGGPPSGTGGRSTSGGTTGTLVPDAGMTLDAGLDRDAAGPGGGGDASDAGAGAGGRGGGGGSTTPDGGKAPDGATSAYNPCPTNGDPCKILPLGDSITHGFASTDDGGYRSQLFNLIVAANQKVTFLGSLTNGPAQVSGQTFPRNHEGHDGWTIDPGFSSFGAGGISSLVPSPAFNTTPHIVLLMIGTNDTGAMDTNGMSTRLEALLDKIAATAPNALMTLATLTPLGYTSAALTAYNAKIPGIVQAHAAKGQHIVGVEMSKMPVPADIASDNVHPNDQGYVYMANVWYAALKDLLPR